MDFFNPIFFGFSIAMIGIALPGMVNMTSVNVSIKRGLRSGFLYSAGSSVTIFLQAYIAVAFAGYLSKHPEVFLYIRAASVAIFLALAFFFFYQALRSKEVKASQRKGRPFLLGVVFGVTGNGPLTRQPIKGDYTRHDLERMARYMDVDWHMPDKFPIPTQHAARAFYWIDKDDHTQYDASDVRMVKVGKKAAGRSRQDPHLDRVDAHGAGLEFGGHLVHGIHLLKSRAKFNLLRPGRMASPTGR